jgi:hypothetical protein
VHVYVTKGGPSESGGDGAHLTATLDRAPAPASGRVPTAIFAAPLVTAASSTASLSDTPQMICRTSTASGAR